jgi:hypothetical protein
MPNGDGIQPEQTTPAPAPIPASGSESAAQSPAMRQMMDRMAQQTAQPRTSLPQPKPNEPSHVTSASGFLPMLFMGIQNAAAAHKEKQIKSATAMYSSLQAAHEKAEQMSQGDPEKTKQLFMKDPVVQETFAGKQGEKNVKAMKELLNVDLMNPEANNTAHHEGLKRVMKAVGVQKVMKLVGTVLGAHKQYMEQQGQTQQQQGDQAAQRAGALADRSVPQPMDVKAGTEIAKADADLIKAHADLMKEQNTLRDTYSPPVVTKSGEVVVYDKKDPTKTVSLHGEDGKPVQGVSKPGQAPKVLFNENVPYAVMRDGKARIPGDPEWTADDQKLIAAAQGATASGEANKAKLATKRETFFSSLPQAVLFKQDDPAKGVHAGELAMVTRKEAGSNPAKYAPVSATDKAMGPQARFGEIQATVDMTNTAIKNLPDEGFDAKTRAQIAYVLRSPDPHSALDGFFKSDVAATLSDAQVDYVTSLTSMAESAQALTSLQGIGARGSDRLRASIVAMLPGSGTPSRKYAETQMKKFQIELDQLHKGVATAGGATPGAPGPGGPTGAISFTDAGVTYDIPKDKVAAFKKAHPNASTAR